MLKVKKCVVEIQIPDLIWHSEKNNTAICITCTKMLGLLLTTQRAAAREIPFAQRHKNVKTMSGWMAWRTVFKIIKR
jgi:hypothetical protein